MAEPAGRARRVVLLTAHVFLDRSRPVVAVFPKILGDKKEPDGNEAGHGDRDNDQQSFNVFEI